MHATNKVKGLTFMAIFLFCEQVRLKEQDLQMMDMQRIFEFCKALLIWPYLFTRRALQIFASGFSNRLTIEPLYPARFSKPSNKNLKRRTGT